MVYHLHCVDNCNHYIVIYAHHSSLIIVSFYWLQVTTYSHKDENNQWIVKRFDRNPKAGEAAEHLKHGDIIRLEHQAYVLNTTPIHHTVKHVWKISENFETF